LTDAAGRDGDHVVVRVEQGAAWVVLNRPEKRNAISMDMRARLSEAVTRLNADDGVRVMVLTGAGPAFSAGVDLAESHDVVRSREALLSRPVAAPLEQFEKPILAAINGPAVGAGLELALAADLRIASSNASFALPEVKIGSLPGSGGTQRLMRLMPAAVATKAIFTGEAFDAAVALRYGLVSDVCAPEELTELATRIAGAIVSAAPLSVRSAKIAVTAALSGAPGHALERALWGMLSMSADRQEGRAAFRERRPPRFTGT
jgi:enoyl-CoA hydratase/carnithine racemase